MIYVVAGARPNFMKVAPILRALRARDAPVRFVHTGQHSSEAMSDVFFRDLGMQAPDALLSISGATHARMTASALVALETDLVESRPRAVVVVGDVTSTLAAALAAAKLDIPVVHVEAGLRSRDWSMPEEINRVLVDAMSDLLLTPSADAGQNLLAEGVDPRAIVQVGNVMIDSLLSATKAPTPVVEQLGLTPRDFILVTLHRPSNVDDAGTLQVVVRVLIEIAKTRRVLFPVHPRTRRRLEEANMLATLGNGGVVVTDPVGYRDFVTLMRSASVVVTDSGGVQEETTALGVPCLTLRATTERPITVTEGTNTLVGEDITRLPRFVDDVLGGNIKRGKIPDGWDGRAGERCAAAIVELVSGARPLRLPRRV